MWWAFLRLTDPGYLGDDQGLARRAISTVVTVLGYILFLGLLIAILTQWLNETIAKLQSGVTPVVVSEHVLILGWSHRTPIIVAELLHTRSRVQRFLERHRARDLRIVIQAERVDAGVYRELRERLGDAWNDRQVLLQAGTPLRIDHLERVAFRDAGVIIVLGADFAERNPEAVDAETLKTLLAVSRHMGESASSRPLAVAELYDLGRAPVARRAYGGDAEILAPDEIAHQVMITDKLMDSKSLFLTANTSTMYVIPTLDLEKDGPIVVEAPPGMLGAFNDAWFRYRQDIGPAGPDKGKGGKYLVLPPGYKGEVPKGYFVVRSKTYRVWVFIRASIAKGLEAAAENVKKHLRIYPLAKKDNPPKMEFISGSGKSFNTIHANDYSFYEHLHALIDGEHIGMLDPETRGLFASIGIEKGKPFAPDKRMKRILEDAVKIANAAARSIVWYPRTEGTMKGIEIYPRKNSAWIMAWVDKNVFFNGKDGQTLNSDARVMFHYPYTAVTPAMAVSKAGAGSDYGAAFVDSKKKRQFGL